ncbi:MAG: cupin domain-containing protein [Chitinivibrionales bacterium]|nr:cupin domain-containing protein [Chitinivibrionales bacterium]MBD3396569.1 cupin domain-containing protein [Chitinivibrionales bacterium]
MNEVELKESRSRIGQVLRAYREGTGRNLSEVADGAGISTSMLSQIERGLVAPSLDTLFLVCDSLSLDIGELFNRVSHREPVRIQRAGQRLVSKRKGARYEQLVASADSRHPAEMFFLTLDPSREVGLGGRGHEGVELGYVLSGSATLTVGRCAYEIQSGDSVSFASHLPHRLANSGRSVFRAIWSVLPPHTDYLGIEDNG